MNLPTEFSISQLAEVLGLPREKIRRRVESGVIPSIKLGTGRNCKRVVLMATLRAQFRDLYEAILLKLQMVPRDDDDEDDD